MNKLKIYNILQLTILASLLLVGISNVKAEETSGSTEGDTTEEKEYVTWVENSKYSIDVSVTGENNNMLKMELNGENADKKYYVFFSNGEKPTVNQGINGCEFAIGDDYSDFHVIYQSQINPPANWYMLEDYNTAWILEKETKNSENYCEISGPITLTKPSLPSLGNRFMVNFLGEHDDFESVNNTLTVFNKFPSSTKYDLNIKIGRIDDNDLLLKLSKNTSDSLPLLLEYAKNNDGTNYNISAGNYAFVKYDYNAIKGVYYYVYVTYKNPDGLRDLSDVSVAMSVTDGILTNDVVYNFGNNGGDGSVPETDNKETNSKVNDEITTNSNTGDALIISFVVLGIGALAYLVYYFRLKKNNV